MGAHRLAVETFRKPIAVELIRSLSRDYEDRYAAQTGKFFLGEIGDMEIGVQAKIL